VPYATDVNVSDAGNVTNPYGWLVCAGGAPLSGVSFEDMVQKMEMRKLIFGQIHCHLEGQITKYGYTETKPAVIIKNETSPIDSFNRRRSSVSVLKTSVIQVWTNNHDDPDECENKLSFYVPDGVFSSLLLLR
jgi:hypothetical protein